MSIVKIIFIIVQVFLSLYLVYPWILKFLKKRERLVSLNTYDYKPDYAVIVTAYKQINIVKGLLSSLTNVNYNNYTVYIVADNCGDFSLDVSATNVHLLVPPKTLGNNIKSHRYAIEHFIKRHDMITIIDSDNLIDREYFNEMNKVFQKGFLAVQGARNARNTNTYIASLDAVSDLYYRYIDRVLLFEAGSSATLSGSGMAFDADLFIKSLKNYALEGAGFDKYLQNEIVSNGHRIAFSNDAVVLDQKIGLPDMLASQRARWINTWFKFFKGSVHQLFNSIRRRDWNMFLFSIAIIRPPLFIMMTGIGTCFLLNMLLMPCFNIVLIGCILTGLASFFYSLNAMRASRLLYMSLLNSPYFFLIQILALFRMRTADKVSVATEHTLNEDSDSFG